MHKTLQLSEQPMEKRRTGRRRIHSFSPRGKLFDLARKKVKLEETPLQSQVLIHTFHVKISEASRRCPIEMSYHDQQACVAGRVLTERTSGGQKRASIIVGAWCSIGTFVKNDQTVCRFLVDFFCKDDERKHKHPEAQWNFRSFSHSPSPRS
jgi:hypothetical protein